MNTNRHDEDGIEVDARIEENPMDKEDRERADTLIEEIKDPLRNKRKQARKRWNRKPKGGWRGS